MLVLTRKDCIAGKQELTHLFVLVQVLVHNSCIVDKQGLVDIVALVLARKGCIADKREFADIAVLDLI